MNCIAPLKPLIMWSRGSPLAPSLIQSSFDGKSESMALHPNRRIRQETPYSVMQFGRFPSSAIGASRRLRFENLDYFEDPKEESSSDFYHFVEWRTGRQLDTEEMRSAIVFRLSALYNTAEKHRMSDTILTCVAKATAADTQMNDITISNLVVHPTEPIRSQWRKVHDADHVLVEDKSTSSTKLPQKYMKHQKLKTHFGHYMKKVSKIPFCAPIVECVCYTENRSLKDVLHRLSYSTGFQAIPNITWIASNSEISREFHVCSAQRLRFIGMTKEAVQSACRKYNLFPVLLTPVNYCQKLEFQSSGTQYTIALREVALRTTLKPIGQFTTKNPQSGLQNTSDCFQALKATLRDRFNSLCTTGFINYFPVQVVGGGGVALYQLGVHFLRGEFTAVLRGFLQLEAERHPVSYDHYVQCVGTPADSLRLRFISWANALLAFRDCAHLRNILQTIAESLKRGVLWEEIAQNIVNSDDFLLINVNRYIEAFQGYIWNCTTNRRLQRSLSLSNGQVSQPKVLVGDIVRFKVIEHGTPHYRFIRIKTEQAALNYSLEDVVIPVMGIGSESTLPHLNDEVNVEQMYARDRFEYDTLMNHFGLSGSAWERKLPTATGSGIFPSELRSLISKPGDLTWHVARDPNSSVALKPDLFCIQEGNTCLNSPFEYSTHENETLVQSVDGETENVEALLDLHKRIRPSSPMNHSPRLKETLQFIQHTNDKTRKLKLTPNPSLTGGLVQKMDNVSLMPYRRSDRCTLLLRFSLPAGTSVSIFLRELFEVVYYRQFNDLM